jgi:MFS family permease
MANLAASKKKSFALIQIGAFLEYFDLYLYVHMAVLLNDIFFPKTDPYTAGLIAAFTFSSTYILRPIGALVFGYLGDNYGRKSTIIITTSLMAFCSFVIASLPSYEKIGITASIVMILCRMLQGFSSIGEFIGALTYVAESTKAPQSYFYTSLVAFFTGLGSTFALLVGSVFLLIDSTEGWRTAFYFGAAIAVIGSVARTQLRETPEFLQEKKQAKSKPVKLNQLLPSPQTRKYFFCYLGVECLRPLYFYFSFIYLGQFLRTHFGYSAAEVIHHNLFISGVEAIAILVYGRMALKIYPLDILKVRGLLFLGFAFCLPFLINHASTPFHLFLIQCGLLILGEGVTPAHALFLKAFPIIGRYTQAALAYAISRIVTTILTSYGCVFIGEYYGIAGITGFLIMAILLHLYSIYQFSKHYNKKSQEIPQH